MLLIDKSPSANKLAPSAITRPNNAFLAFAGNFTIEIFKMKFADTATQVLLGNYNASSPFSNNRCWQLQYTSGTGLVFIGSLNGSTTTTVTYSWTPTTGVEYDLCVDRSGSTVRIYTDGTFRASGTISGGLFNTTTTYFTIGQGSVGSGFGSPTTGSAKALRITDGTARYATGTSYTVPSLPLPTS